MDSDCSRTGRSRHIRCLCLNSADVISSTLCPAKLGNQPRIRKWHSTTPQLGHSGSFRVDCSNRHRDGGKRHCAFGLIVFLGQSTNYDSERYVNLILSSVANPFLPLGYDEFTGKLV
jgi:hypothetical protein